ncbi:division/cell wall cluster transcriptional repressor MraZ [Candidatus Parcubacteria bacterium]|nr:division/cell wall cluster transcriptional repressor MraZ [Patescibacteria group bacterium]MBU4482060.1 division/cell wall cluster transcriptional repressor MraZ [Patescibacteria group bacterium]MCG2687114.1 division/cell wall cluster transcriptional repressor MraZ [Candidatus Parcubacteria bacterium]
MFIGEYNHNLDSKNRLALPTKFRADLKNGAVVTKGVDNCLFIFTKTDWQTFVDKIIQQPIGKADARGFSRIMLAGAMDVKLDSLGRILLPDYLKTYASLKKKTVVAGLYNRLEIWDEQKWDNYKKQIEKNAEKLAEAMGELGV